jgi:glycosyltransferase involved in cell wall biosynthesis
MKVAIWTNSPSPHQCDFHEALRMAGVDLRVLYFGDLRRARREMGWSQPSGLPAGEQVLATLADPLDQLHDWRERVHVIPGYSRWVNLSIALKLSRAGVPWVHWSENSQPSWRSLLSWSIKKAYARLVNGYALGAFAHGDAAGHDFVRWGVRRELIAHLFYAVQGVRPNVVVDPVTAAFTRGRTAFLYVGAICRNKASKELIEAFALAAKDRDDACLVMVGNGPHIGACERLAAQRGVADRVLFRGVVPNADIGSVMKSCRVAVLPSRYDGWGVVLNEAASAGLALVASDCVGAAYHLIEPGFNGFRVRPGSAPSLSAVLRAYVSDAALAREHGERSLRRFQDFRPERNAERFIGAIRGWMAASNAWASWRESWTAKSPSVRDEKAA